MKAIQRQLSAHEKNVWTACVYISLCSIASGGADFHHFTWISIGMFTAISMLAIAGYDTPYFWVFIATQIRVVFAVNLMAFDDCEVFEDSFHKYGPLIYGIGTFMMHNALSLIVFAMATRIHILCGLYKALSQIWIASAIYFVWYWFQDPWETYGCTLPSVIGIAGDAALTIALSFSIIALHNHFT